MRAAPGMHVQWVESEAVVLNETTGHLHYLNSSAALVYASILEFGVDDALARLNEGAAEERHIELAELLDEMHSEGLLVD